MRTRRQGKGRAGEGDKTQGNKKRNKFLPKSLMRTTARPLNSGPSNSMGWNSSLQLTMARSVYDPPTETRSLTMVVFFYEWRMDLGNR